MNYALFKMADVISNKITRLQNMLCDPNPRLKQLCNLFSDL